MLIKASVSKNSGNQSEFFEKNAETTSSFCGGCADYNKLNESISKLELANEYLTPIIGEIITHATTYSQRDFRRILETKSPICTISYGQFSKAFRASEIISEVNDDLQLTNEFKSSPVDLYRSVTMSNPYDELIQTINEVGDRIYIDRDLMKQLVDLHELIADTIKKLRAALIAGGVTPEEDEMEKPEEAARTQRSNRGFSMCTQRGSVISAERQNAIEEDEVLRSSLFEPTAVTECKSCEIVAEPENLEKKESAMQSQRNKTCELKISQSKQVQTESNTYFFTTENNALIVNSVEKITQVNEAFPHDEGNKTIKPIASSTFRDDEENITDIKTSQKALPVHEGNMSDIRTSMSIASQPNEAFPNDEEDITDIKEFKPVASSSLKNEYNPVEFEKMFIIINKPPEKGKTGCNCCANICNKTPTTTVQQMTQTNEFKITNPPAFTSSYADYSSYAFKEVVENCSQTTGVPIILQNYDSCLNNNAKFNTSTEQTSSQIDGYVITNFLVKHKHSSKVSVDKCTSFTNNFYNDFFKVSTLFPLIENTNRNYNNNAEIPTLGFNPDINKGSQICLRINKIVNKSEPREKILEQQLKQCTVELGQLKKMYKDLLSVVDHMKTNHASTSENQVTSVEGETTKKASDDDFNYNAKSHEEILAHLKESEEFKELLSGTDNASITLDEVNDCTKNCCRYEGTPHIHAILNDIPITIKLHQSKIDILLSEKEERATAEPVEEEIKKTGRKLCDCKPNDSLNETNIGPSPIKQNVAQGGKIHISKKCLKVKNYKNSIRKCAKIRCLKSIKYRIKAPVESMFPQIHEKFSPIGKGNSIESETPSISNRSGSNSSYYTIKSKRSACIQTAVIESNNLPYKKDSVELIDSSGYKSSISSLPYLVHKCSLPTCNTCPSMDVSINELKSIMRSDIIRHPKERIRKQLAAFGVDNIIAASKPASCCRKAVINEVEKEEEPFHASLNSLPLNNSDIQLITEVAGVEKIFMSTYLAQIYKNKFEYYTNFQENLTSNIDYFLPKTPVYEVRFFEIFWKDVKNSNKDTNNRSNVDKEKFSSNSLKKDNEEQKIKNVSKERKQYQKHNHSERHRERHKRKLYNKMCQTEGVISEAFYFQTSSNSLPRNCMSASVSQRSSTRSRASATKPNKIKVDPLGDNSSLSPKNYAETLSAIYELDDSGKLRPKGKMRCNQSNEFKRNSSNQSTLSGISFNGNRVKGNRSNQSGSSDLSYSHAKEFKANSSHQSALSGLSFNSNLGTIFESDEKHKDKSATTSVKSKSIDDFLELIQNPEITDSVHKFISSEAAMKAFERSNIDFNKFWSIYFEEKHNKSVGCETNSAKSNSRSSLDTLPPKLKAKKKIPKQRAVQLSDSSSDNLIRNRAQRRKLPNSQLEEAPVERCPSMRMLEEMTVKQESTNSLRSLQMLASKNGPGYISVLHPVCGCPEVSIFIPCYCDDCDHECCKCHPELTAKRTNRLVSTQNGRHIILPKTCRIQKGPSEISNCGTQSSEIGRRRIHKTEEISNFKTREISNLKTREISNFKTREIGNFKSLKQIGISKIRNSNVKSGDIQQPNEIRIPTKMRTNGARIRVGERFHP